VLAAANPEVEMLSSGQGHLDELRRDVEPQYPEIEIDTPGVDFMKPFRPEFGQFLFAIMTLWGFKIPLNLRLNIVDNSHIYLQRLIF
jgi:hypothetical protein